MSDQQSDPRAGRTIAGVVGIAGGILFLLLGLNWERSGQWFVFLVGVVVILIGVTIFRTKGPAEPFDIRHRRPDYQGIEERNGHEKHS